MPLKDKRLALIVASSEFNDETLRQLVAPSQDAADLARVLQDDSIGGFEIKVLTNHPSYDVRREIEEFFANRKRGDLLLLYFSGHGIKDDDGRLYLATTDTRRGMFRSTAVPATFVNETMTASRSRRQVLILDCCHSGAFARGMVAKGGESVDIHDRFEGRGRVVLTASNSTQYAFQGDEIIGAGVNSVFTYHLVHGLETGAADLDGDGWVSLDELYDYVYERVTDETPQQTPGKWTFDLQGEITIAHSPLGRQTPETKEPGRARQYEERSADRREDGSVCPHCGAIVRSDARFCPQCGSSLSAGRASAADESAGPRVEGSGGQFAIGEQILQIGNVQGGVINITPSRPTALPEEMPQSGERQRLAQLREIISTRFNREELRTLCFDLGVDYDDLPGEGKAGKARELVAQLARMRQLPSLIETGRKLRPDVPWEDWPGEQSHTRPARLPEE